MPTRPIPPSSLLRLLLASGAPMQPHVLAILLQQGALTVYDLARPMAAPSLVDMVTGPAGCMAGQPGAVADADFDPAEEWDRAVWLPMSSPEPHPDLPHLHSSSPADPTQAYPVWALWLMSLSGNIRARGAAVLFAAFNRHKKIDPTLSLDVLAPLDVVTPSDSSGGSRLFVWRVIDLLALSLPPKTLGRLLDTLPPDRLRDLRQRRPAAPSWPMLSLNWIHDTQGCRNMEAPIHPYADFSEYRKAYLDVLTAHGWSLDLPDVSGRPPILHAQSLAAARFLVQMGADPRVKTADGQSLIDVAASWDLRAAARVSALSEVQGWISARTTADPQAALLSPQEQLHAARQQNLKAAEALLRTAPITSLRPVLRSLKDPLPGEDPLVLITALLRRIQQDDYPNRSTLALLRWTLSKDKKGGWWDFDATLSDIPTWTVRNMLDIMFSAFPGLGGASIPSQSEWALPLSSPAPVAAFVRWSNRPFFKALPALTMGRTYSGTTMGSISGAALMRSFRYAGPTRPLDQVLAMDACVEDVAPGRVGQRACLGLMDGTTTSRIGGHGRIFEHWSATCDNPVFSEEIRSLWERAALMTARRIIIAAGADVLSFSQDLKKSESFKDYQKAISLSTVHMAHQLCSDPGVQRRNPAWFADTMLLLATPARRLAEEYQFGKLDVDISSQFSRSDCSVYTTTMAQLSSNAGYDHLKVRPAIRGALKALLDYLVLSFGLPEPPPDEDAPAVAERPVLVSPRRRM